MCLAVRYLALLLQDVEQKPLHDYFINFPGVSRWHWHPLTCLYPQGAQGQPGKTVTFAMKQKGSWSTVSPLSDSNATPRVMASSDENPQSCTR